MHISLLHALFVSEIDGDLVQTNHVQMERDEDLATRFQSKHKQSFEQRKVRRQSTVWTKANQWVAQEFADMSRADLPRRGQYVMSTIIPDCIWNCLNEFCPEHHRQVVSKVSILQVLAVLHGWTSTRALPKLFVLEASSTARMSKMLTGKLCKKWLMHLVVPKSWWACSLEDCEFVLAFVIIANLAKVYFHSSKWCKDWLGTEISSGAYSRFSWRGGGTNPQTYEMNAQEDCVANFIESRLWKVFDQRRSGQPENNTTTSEWLFIQLKSQLSYDSS